MDEVARSVKGYRARAEQLSLEADAIANPETKKALLSIAASYERLAIAIEANANRLSISHAS